MSHVLTLDDGWTELIPAAEPIEDAAATIRRETTAFTDLLEGLDRRWSAVVEEACRGVGEAAFAEAMERPRRDILDAER
ncbi:hypothetical protein [Micrococcus porci]|uniref:hypothetical protein n=1 Tax=Micrococcus porci TaxID=2856555 RepID=UPI003CE6BA91